MTRRRDDGDRGVSFTVSYVLTLAITVLLVSGVVLAVGEVVRDQRESAVRDQATVVGDDVAATVMAADRLVRNGNDSSVAIRVSLADELAGTPYVVELTVDPSPAVVVRTQSPSVTVRVPVQNRTALRGATVTGGDVRVTSLDGNETLTVTEGDP